MYKQKINIFIQARMGSKRLPGKVLKIIQRRRHNHSIFYSIHTISYSRYNRYSKKLLKNNQKNESRKKLYFSAAASTGLLLFGFIIFA